MALVCRLTASAPSDQWDLLAKDATGQDSLVAVATQYLTARNDQALGLAPAQFLPSAVAPYWILYWCAARRVDDSVESGHTTVAEWRERLTQDRSDTLAEACIKHLHSVEPLQRAGLDRLLRRSLAGIEQEAAFTRPQSWQDYLALLDLKSTPTMEVFDALLAPDEEPFTRSRHALAFAASAQIGDDCRDALRDLARNRCFITKEEVGARPDLDVYARSPAFAQGRAELCIQYLLDAESEAHRFRSTDARKGASRLHDLWRHAIQTGQVRPTKTPLALLGRPPHA